MSTARDCIQTGNLIRVNVGLEMDSRYVKPREDNIRQRHSLSRQDGGVRMHASDQQVGVQKFECGFGIGSLLHQVETRPGLCHFDRRLTPGSIKSGTLHRSVCKRPNSWTFLLALSLDHRAMNPFFVAVCVSTMGSQGCMSTVSRYHYVLGRCEVQHRCHRSRVSI